MIVPGLDLEGWQRERLMGVIAAYLLDNMDDDDVILTRTYLRAYISAPHWSGPAIEFLHTRTYELRDRRNIEGWLGLRHRPQFCGNSGRMQTATLKPSVALSYIFTERPFV